MTGSVLIVDDDAAIRDLLRRWLEQLDYEVFEADGASAALLMLRRHPIGVVLCDYSMPGHRGDWLIGEIRTAFPAVAVILATAEDSLPPRISLQRNVVGYLVKPFSRASLLSAVHDALLWHGVAGKRRT
jgi:two-component system C4-dicarboxylate transport response regulator DctD